MNYDLEPRPSYHILASLSLNLTIFEYKSYSLAKETPPFHPHYEWLVAEGRNDKGYKGGQVQPNNLGFSHPAGDRYISWLKT